VGCFHLIDDEFREDPGHFLLQSSLAFVVVAAIVLVMGALARGAVSLGLLRMVVTDTEHPPAAGNALAFAVAPIGLEHALFTAGAVVFLSLVRYALRGWLKDLA
jgi:hypothetical protein